MVHQTDQYRPVSITDDFSTLIDALWLDKTQEVMRSFAGAEQAGGSMDPMLVVIAVVITAQLRAKLELPTFMTIADLRQGYDVAWHDAIRVLAKQEGVSGRWWLFLDSQLSRDAIQMRVGGVVGPARNVCGHAIGQGRKAAVQLFGLLTRPLTNLLHDHSQAVGIAFPEVALLGLSAAKPLADVPQEGGQGAAEMAFRAKQAMADKRGVEWWKREIGGAETEEDRLGLLEAVAVTHGPRIFQFIDDSITAQGSLQGVRVVCRCLEAFVRNWGLALAKGHKTTPAGFGTSGLGGV